MEGIIFGIVALVLLMIGVPIGFSLSIAILALLAYNPILPTTFVAQSMYSSLDSFTMLAIPAFLLAGAVMESGGLSKRLINVANLFVGNSPGGLGNVAILACVFFGAISGSSPATVAAIGMIMIPQMVKYGYSLDYATALIAVSGGLGVIVPPSIPMILYGVANSVSIGGLFMAGIGPAALLALLLMATNTYLCKKKGYLGTGEKLTWTRFKAVMKDSVWALIMPVIILGGIYSGVFTATESAVVALFYGIIVGLFVYKELSLKGIWKTFFDNTSFLGGMMLVFAPVAALGSVLVYLGFTDALADLLFSFSTDANVVMFLMIIIMFFIGMFVNTTPCIVILSPIFLQIVSKVGVGAMHFGILMVLYQELAFITPPVCPNMFVASSISGLPIEKIVKQSFPFMLATLVVILLCTYIPGIVLTLPKALGLMS